MESFFWIVLWLLATAALTSLGGAFAVLALAFAVVGLIVAGSVLLEWLAGLVGRRAPRR